MTRRALRAPLAKDQLHGLSTKNKEHGKNYENYRNAMRRPFSLPLARGVVARRTPQPLLMPVLAYLHEQRSVLGGATDPGAPEAFYCSTVGPQAREHPKPSAPPARCFLSSCLKDRQVMGEHRREAPGVYCSSRDEVSCYSLSCDALATANLHSMRMSCC